MNKKASFFVPFVTIMAILGIVIVLFILGNEANNLEPAIGERQHDIFLAYEQVESARTYIEHSAKFALDEAVVTLFEKGELRGCEEYLNFDVLNGDCRDINEQVKNEWEDLFEERKKTLEREYGDISVALDDVAIVSSDKIGPFPKNYMPPLIVRAAVTIEYSDNRNYGDIRHITMFELNQSAEFNLIAGLAEIQAAFEDKEKKAKLTSANQDVDDMGQKIISPNIRSINYAQTNTDNFNISAGSCFEKEAKDAFEGVKREKFYQFADHLFNCLDQTENKGCSYYNVRNIPKNNPITIKQERNNIELVWENEELILASQRFEYLEPFTLSEGDMNCIEGEDYITQHNIKTTATKDAAIDLSSNNTHCGSCGNGVKDNQQCK